MTINWEAALINIVNIQVPIMILPLKINSEVAVRPREVKAIRKRPPNQKKRSDSLIIV